MEQQLQPTYPVSVTQGEDTLANISSPQEEVRTLYLSGFPFDVKQREVHNLLRFFPGYEECTFKTSGVAFALFSDSVKAAAAMQALNGLDFDPHMRAILRVDFAKQNSKRKRDAGDKPREGEGEVLQGRDEKRSKHTMASAAMHPSLLAYGQYYNAQMNPYAYDAYGFPVMPAMSPPSRPRPPPSPCCTLYLSNLNPALTETDLLNTLTHFDGYSRMQLLSKGDSLSAFIQFRDLTSSANALQSLPSYTIPSADGISPIRVEYARNEMVIRDDSHPTSRQSANTQFSSYPSYKH